MKPAPRTKDGRHHFKWAITPQGFNARIDKDIFLLCNLMWSLGIKTTNSCHSHCNFTCKHKRNSKGYIIPTKNCYSNVWLAFESCKDVEKLYNLVAEYEPDNKKQLHTGTMYDKMSCDRFVSTRGCAYASKEGWAFSFLMHNLGVQGHWGRPIFNGKRSTQEMWVEDGCKKNKFVIQPQITFPRAHIPYVENRLFQALERKTFKSKMVSK